METKDVKELKDIPNMEAYLDSTFELVNYEAGDRIMCYEFIDINNKKFIISIIFH